MHAYLQQGNTPYSSKSAGELLFSLAAHSLAVRYLWITSDGVVATASDDKEIRLWDLRMPWNTDMG
jgi:WD40 repeat protein